MVIEHFKASDGGAVYELFHARGRMAPDGLHYLASWVEANDARCFQVMDTDDPALLDAWMANWSDLVDFEVVPVVTSAEAAARHRTESGRRS